MTTALPLVTPTPEVAVAAAEAHELVTPTPDALATQPLTAEATRADEAHEFQDAAPIPPATLRSAARTRRIVAALLAVIIILLLAANAWYVTTDSFSDSRRTVTTEDDGSNSGIGQTQQF